jgi:hypothetical protein
VDAKALERQELCVIAKKNYDEDQNCPGQVEGYRADAYRFYYLANQIQGNVGDGHHDFENDQEHASRSPRAIKRLHNIDYESGEEQPEEDLENPGKDETNHLAVSALG